MNKARRPQSNRGPGSYVVQACNVCRHKKIKCDGRKPCKTCANSGRQSECAYGKEPPRRPRTEAHFQAMLRDNRNLRDYIRILESHLEQCSKEHPGSMAHLYLDSRPTNLEEVLESPEEAPGEVSEEGPEAKSDNDVAIQLCLPTQKLRIVEEGGLLLHGGTAPFRYSEPIPPQSSISRHWAISENPSECYVLLVEGADESHYNPNLEWSRHLPAEVRLSRREHDKIIDLVLRFFTNWCLRIVPSLFLRDMCRALSAPKNRIPRLSHYSPMLHNAILALGTAFSDDPAIRDLKARMYFLDKAKSYMEDECSRPHLCVVNALSLIASFHSGQGDPTLGFVYFGIAARVGQALGLDVDCSSWVQTGYITAEDQMDRNWAYWTTFSQDVCWTLYVGRQFSIPTMSQNIPIPFTDADFDEMDWTSSAPGHEVKTFGPTCRLLQITKGIMDVVNAIDGPCSRQVFLDAKISEIDVALHDWESSLPDELKNTNRMRQSPLPHLLQLHLTFEWSFILLHRPFFKRRSARSMTYEHSKLCQRAADNTMVLLDVWRQHYTLRYAPITLIQTIFAAGTIWLLSALQAVEGVRIANEQLRQAMRKTLLCIDYLKEIGTSWPCATAIGRILRTWMQATKPQIRQRTALSPFSSGILPPKIPERLTQGQIRVDDVNDEKVSKRKSTDSSAIGSRKRHRPSNETKDSPSIPDDVRGRSVESGFSLVPPLMAPLIAVDPPLSDGDNGNTTNVGQAISPRPPLPAHPAAPPSLAFQSEHHSPQPPQGHPPFGDRSPLPVVNGLAGSQVSPPRLLHVQASPRAFIPVSPQPHGWIALPDSSGDTTMTDAALSSSRPALEPTQSQEAIQRSQSQSLSPLVMPDIKPLTTSTSSIHNTPNIASGSEAPDSFNVEVNLHALAKASNIAPLLLSNRIWAPGALHCFPLDGAAPSISVSGEQKASHGATSTSGSSGPKARSISSTSLLAIPGDQRPGEALFMPFSMPLQEEADNDLELGQDGEGMAGLNELGFEFVNRQVLAEGFGDKRDSVANGEADTDMEGRGREGWEDISEDLEEEEIMSWFNAIEN